MIINIKNAILEGYTYEDVLEGIQSSTIEEGTIKNNLAKLATAGIIGASALGSGYAGYQLSHNPSKAFVTEQAQKNKTIIKHLDINELQNTLKQMPEKEFQKQLANASASDKEMRANGIVKVDKDRNLTLDKEKVYTYVDSKIPKNTKDLQLAAGALAGGVGAVGAATLLQMRRNRRR